jgi:hypothetical protein
LNQSMDDGPSEPQGERWTMDVFLVSNSRLLVSSVLLAFSCFELPHNHAQRVFLIRWTMLEVEPQHNLLRAPHG